MINYTLTIPTNKKVSKNNSNVVGSVDYKSIALPTELQGHLEKAYIYSRIESQDSFRPFFYAQIIGKIFESYTESIPKIPILFLYLIKNVAKTGIKTATYSIVILLAVYYNIVITYIN
jgi:hypothetical protein